MKKEYKSKCCKAKVLYSDPSPDFIGDNFPTVGTCYCYCSKCKEACDIFVNVRKFWNRNPKTQVLGDKREKIQKKLTKKEIQNIRMSEDF